MPGHSKPPLALKPADFYILLVLCETPLHGYGLRKAVARESGGAAALEIGSLYRLLDRLLDEGWIEASAHAPAGADERRRYYRLTPGGRRVLQGEAARLREVVRRLGKRELLGDARGAR